MFVGADYLAKGCSKYGCIGESLFYTGNHAFKAIDLCFDSFSASLRAFDSKTKLEIFFITDQNIGNGGYFGENIP
jgi:hypothetical protein